MMGRGKVGSLSSSLCSSHRPSCAFFFPLPSLLTTQRVLCGGKRYLGPFIRGKIRLFVQLKKPENSPLVPLITSQLHALSGQGVEGRNSLLLFCHQIKCGSCTSKLLWNCWLIVPQQKQKEWVHNLHYSYVFT